MTIRALAAAAAFLPIMSAQQPTEIKIQTIDGGSIVANVYGAGDHAVVLAHGAVFDKESWHDQAVRLAKKGLRVAAIDFRGYGRSQGGSEGRALHLDVLSAVRRLRRDGAREISVVGGSMGARASAQASMESKPGEIDRLILLAPPPFENPEKLRGEILFIVSEGDGLASFVKQAHKAAPEPKKLTVLPGSAHAQHIFKTDQAEALFEAIANFVGE